MTEIAEIPAVVDKVRRGFRDGVQRVVADRETQLRQLRRFLEECEADLAAALRSDLGKSALEAYSTEIGFTLGEIAHVLDHLHRWSAPRKVSVPLHQKPGHARIVPEPLGTVLVIAPWNYPVQLSLAPLIPALAAGNTAVVKPSEVAPATAELLATRLPDYLDARVVQVVTGGVDETTALLRERFDHIFYTGNGEVAKVVMRAAAEHLTPVTLELGGKSPAIVTRSARVDVAARRLAWGKFINAGQTCVAPDYVLVDRDVHDELVDALVGAIGDFYGADPGASPDYGRIVNLRHLDRLTSLLDAGGFDAIATGGSSDTADRYLAPTVLTGVSPDAKVMDGEIFGPILPVLPYDDVADAIDFVNARPKPLAMYVFSERDTTVDRILGQTSSGGVTVNHTLLHLAIPELPFGGVGASGMGAYHGEQGFRTFSHDKPVLQRGTRPDPKLAYPPYSSLDEKVIRRVL